MLKLNLLNYMQFYLVLFLATSYQLFLETLVVLC